MFIPDWGETFTGKRDPSLVVVNLDNYEIKVLDQLQGNMSPGQVRYETSNIRSYGRLRVCGPIMARY